LNETSESDDETSESDDSIDFGKKPV